MDYEPFPRQGTGGTDKRREYGTCQCHHGTAFKRREPAAYALLVEELAKRNGRYLAVLSHAKVTLIGNHKTSDYIVVETSANMSKNNKVEQTAITNDRELYDFYRDWFESVYMNHEKGQALW